MSSSTTFLTHLDDDDAFFRQFLNPALFPPETPSSSASDEPLLDCLLAPLAQPKPLLAPQPPPMLLPSPAPTVSPLAFAPIKRAPESTMTMMMMNTSKRIASSQEDSLERRRERNRLAAERCRQRKMDLIQRLQAECALLQAERERLVEENRRLMAQIRQL